MEAKRKTMFGAALIAHLPALRRYATALVGHPAAADDLVQDCIERALNQAAGLKDLQRIGGWLRSILHNLHIDEMRRKARQGMSVDLVEVEDSLAAVTPARDHAFAIDIDRAMAGLSFEHRQILLLIGLEGLNYREVASELDIPIGTVMSRLARARRQMRAGLERETSVPPDKHPTDGADAKSES